MTTKKSSISIKLAILRNLKKMPMSMYELSVVIKTSFETIQRNIKYLERLGKVEFYKIPELDKTLWIIKKKRRLNADMSDML